MIVAAATKPMQKIIFDKSDKGRDEIITRKYKLANRLRTLLVLIDGRQSTNEVLTKVVSLGLTEANLLELEQQGYIQRLTSRSTQSSTH